MSADAKQGEEPVEVRVEADRDVVTVGRWELSIWRDLGDGEPRVRDTDVAAVLGFDRARNIRNLIERIWPENNRPRIRSTVARNGRGRRPSAEYWLTEAELLKLCARSEAPVAEAVLDDMIRVYMAVRCKLLAPPPAPAPTLPAPLPPALAPALSEDETWIWRLMLVTAFDCDERALAARAAAGAVDPASCAKLAASLRGALAWARALQAAYALVVDAAPEDRPELAGALARSLHRRARGPEWGRDRVFHFALYFEFHNDDATLRRALRLVELDSLARTRDESTAALEAALATVEYLAGLRPVLTAPESGLARCAK